MSIADGAQQSLHYVLNSGAYGATPATPTFTELPNTGCTLGIEKDPLESMKIRGDRQVQDFRHGNRKAGGEITAELQSQAFDDMIEALLGDSWTANVLKIGNTRRDFVFERGFADLDTVEYHRTLGGEVNSLALSVGPNKMVEATFGIVAQDLAISTSQIAGATYNPETGGAPFDSYTGSINEGGSPIAVVTALDMTIANEIEPRFVLFDDKTIEPSTGKIRVSGTLTAFYENSALYEKFLNETESSLDFTFSDGSNTLQFDIPRVKFNSGNPDYSGVGSITVPLEFVGLYDAVEASSLVVTRT